MTKTWGEFGQGVDNVFAQSVAEVLLFRIVAHIDKCSTAMEGLSGRGVGACRETALRNASIILFLID